MARLPFCEWLLKLQYKYTLLEMPGCYGRKTEQCSENVVQSTPYSTLVEVREQEEEEEKEVATKTQRGSERRCVAVSCSILPHMG